MNKTSAISLAAVTVIAPLMTLAPIASADGMPTEGGEDAQLNANLEPVPFSKMTGTGTAHVSLKGNTASVKVKANGLLKDAPHAQHFHIAAKGVCPPASAAKKRNDIKSINTTDGQPFYGDIGTSLTTSGDTSPDSALAVDRFPTGPDFTYERSIEVSDAAAKSLREGTGVVVVHGVDVNGNGEYDNVLGPSDLDPNLPSEATNPALCGSLKMGAKGAVAGGEGSTQSNNPSTTTLAGAGGLLSVAAVAMYLRRRTSRQS
ncbi:hypothetical protein [Streptomyces oceani]|nr:hypothetical protein [Streptomyces oceani]